MENQDNSNPQPDYSFILNQPSEAPGPFSPIGGKSHKKIIIIIVCLVVFFVGLTAIVVLVNKPQSSPNNTSNTTNVPPSINPVDQFLEALKKEDYVKAANLLPGAEDTKQSSATNLQTTFAKIDMSSCKVTALNGSKVSSYSELSCRRIDSSYILKVSFMVAQDGATPLIMTYKIGAENIND